MSATLTHIVSNIDGRIQELEDELSRLHATRNILVDAPVEVKQDQAVKVTLQQKGTRARRSNGKPTVITNGRSASERRAARLATNKEKRVSSSREQQRASARNHSTRADAIIELTNEGWSPNEIADELDASISYVYLVRRKNQMES